MSTYSKFLKEIEIKPEIYEITYQMFDSGSCQCYRDCDCYSNKGQLLGINIAYRNNKVINWNGKPRLYNTLKGCEDSLASWYNKQ